MNEDERLSRVRYEEVDVTDWTAWREEALGTKPKRWLIEPATNVSWLLKLSTWNRLYDGTMYRKGDDWSERVACGVAMVLGLPAAQTELALLHAGGEREYGVISRDVRSESGEGVGATDEELIDGNELLAEPVVGKGRDTYTVDAVRVALMDVQAPAGCEFVRTAWDAFVGYLVLDAVVGNTDRHEENWAVIAGSQGRRLAPTFDHASCLGFQLADEQREDRLATRDRGFTPEAYADRARSPFAGRPHPVDVARIALSMPGTSPGLPWLDRVRDTEALVEPIWAVPQGRMSGAAREFAERVVRRNSQRLLDSRQ